MEATDRDQGPGGSDVDMPATLRLWPSESGSGRGGPPPAAPLDGATVYKSRRADEIIRVEDVNLS